MNDFNIDLKYLGTLCRKWLDESVDLVTRVKETPLYLV